LTVNKVGDGIGDNSDDDANDDGFSDGQIFISRLITSLRLFGVRQYGK
tara:strand:+ start:260 stop:403 length:144 start_codon:yes stop_codon:yes gene_type:complete